MKMCEYYAKFRFTIIMTSCLNLFIHQDNCIYVKLGAVHLSWASRSFQKTNQFLSFKINEHLSLTAGEVHFYPVLTETPVSRHQVTHPPLSRPQWQLKALVYKNRCKRTRRRRNLARGREAGRNQ